MAGSFSTHMRDVWGDSTQNWGKHTSLVSALREVALHTATQTHLHDKVLLQHGVGIGESESDHGLGPHSLDCDRVRG